MSITEKVPKKPCNYDPIKRFPDVCGGADIEQMETLTVFLEQHPKDEAAYSWFHWFMMGALLKYKNLQRRIMQKKISQTKFMTFMMGLHKRAGAESKGILIIRLKDYVFSRKKSKQILQVYLHNGCRLKIGSKTPVDIQ